MDPFIGEIRIFTGNYAPRGWAFCDGLLMNIVQNTPLFAVLGTIYGGDGKQTFGLPNLQGRAPMHQGAGPGLTPRTSGQTGGTKTVTLLSNQMPVHSHVPQCVATGSVNTPGGAVWGGAQRGGANMYASVTNTTMSPQALAPSGGSQPHNNVQPSLAVSYIIALEGMFPPRS